MAVNLILGQIEVVNKICFKHARKWTNVTMFLYLTSNYMVNSIILKMIYDKRYYSRLVPISIIDLKPIFQGKRLAKSNLITITL